MRRPASAWAVYQRAVRPSATTATAPATSEISSPAAVQCGTTVCTARSSIGKPGKNASRLSPYVAPLPIGPGK